MLYECKCMYICLFVLIVISTVCCIVVLLIVCINVITMGDRK